jgi:hypothetical protein
VSVTGERIHGFVTVTNGGNVPAHRVRVDISLPGARIRPAGEQTLEAARSADFPFEGRVAMLLKGTHPMSVMVHFQDSLGHPFSALTVTTFLVREEKAVDLKVLGESVVLGERGTVRFQIENTGALPKVLRTSFLVPREFLPSDPLGESVLLPGGDRKEAAFTITNLSALPGATYPVFCIVEYDREDTHHTAIGMSTVLVTGGENWLRKTRWAWAGGLPALGALLAICGTIRRKRKGTP